MPRTMCVLLTAACVWTSGGLDGRATAQDAPAETERELETDRDSFTPSTGTVGAGRSIFEASYSFLDRRVGAETHSFPETLLRYGLTERIELRAGWNFEIGGGVDVTGNAVGERHQESESGSGESELLYGAKAALSEQAGWIPRSAVILQGYVPTSGEAKAGDLVFAYACGWEFAEGWRLDSALRFGTEHDVGDSFHEWAPSIVVRAPLAERWNVHAEYFGLRSRGARREFVTDYFSTGVHCLVAPNLELGTRVGWGLSDDAANFFSNVGLGLRY